MKRPGVLQEINMTKTTTKEEEIEAPASEWEEETLLSIDMNMTEEIIETRAQNTEMREMIEERGGGSMAMAMKSEGTAQGP